MAKGSIRRGKEKNDKREKEGGKRGERGEGGEREKEVDSKTQEAQNRIQLS